MLTPASAATSSRRSPGVRRRPLSTRPTSAGRNASRRARRNTPRSVESVTGPVCRTPSISSWPQHSQDASSPDRLGLPHGARRADHHRMTTTTNPTLPLVPGRWAVDPAHSSVGFTVRHLGVSKVRGRFNTFDVDVVIGDTLDDTSITARIDVASIDTGNADRDAHVLSADILDVERRPTLEFRSTRVTGVGAHYAVDGELTIGEITRPITLAVELGGVETFPGGPRHAGFEATTQIKRKDFGIDIALPPGVSSVALGDVIKVEIDLQLLEPDTTG